MKKVKISDLPVYNSLDGLYTIGTDKDNRSVRVSLDFIEKRVAQMDDAEDRVETLVEQVNGLSNIAEDATDAIARIDAAIANVRNGEDGADGRLQIVHHEPDDNVFALTPNVMHVWGTQDSLELSLNTEIEEEGILAEYAFQFTCPSYVGTNLVLPANIKWYNDFIVVPQVGKTYQASIVNNIIIMGGV